MWNTSTVTLMNIQSIVHTVSFVSFTRYLYMKITKDSKTFIQLETFMFLKANNSQLPM